MFEFSITLLNVSNEYTELSRIPDGSLSSRYTGITNLKHVFMLCKPFKSIMSRFSVSEKCFIPALRADEVLNSRPAGRPSGFLTGYCGVSTYLIDWRLCHLIELMVNCRFI